MCTILPFSDDAPMETFEDEMMGNGDDDPMNNNIFQDCISGLVDEGIVLNDGDVNSNEQDAFFDFEEEEETASPSGGNKLPLSPNEGYPRKSSVSSANLPVFTYDEDIDAAPRNRLVRFADQSEEEDSKTPNLLMAGGLAAGGLVAGGFANMKTGGASSGGSGTGSHNNNHMNTSHDSDASIDMLDIFDEGVGSSSKLSSTDDDDDDDSDMESVDSQEEQEKEIRKKIAFAVGGVAIMGLLGMGAKKIMSKLAGGNATEDAAQVGTEAAADAVDDATAVAVHLSADAATQASFNASASQSSFGFVAVGAGNNQAAMSGAQ